VIKARTWFTLFLVSVGTVAATASCGGSDEATGGGGGAAGGGIIGASGKGGAVGRAGSGGAVGRAGSGGGPATGTTTALGAVCSADSDCDAGMTCITADSSDFGPGGPSQGMCTLACTSDEQCTALDGNSGCVPFGTAADPNGFCLQKCTQGGDATTADTKCQGRPDFSCRDLAAENAAAPAPFCVPQCRADLECGPGLFCSPRSGLCTKTAPTGDPVGTPCDATADTNTCSGICIGVPNADGSAIVSGFCADLCSGGGGCMYTSGATPSPKGYCIGALSQDFGIGDLGFCEPTCGCTDECTIKGDVCRGWANNDNEQQLKGVLGADGLCLPDASDSVELTACPAAGAAGAAP